MEKKKILKLESALLFLLFAFISFSSLLLPEYSYASGSLCAVVKIEIKQELTLERQAFDAHMRINNSLNIPLNDVDINVNFADEDGNPVLASSDPDNTSALFYRRVDTMDNITGVDGDGTVDPESAADIHWLIIPALGASNGLNAGTLYFVGATLTYTVGGEQEVIEVSPDYIFVKPMPELTLDYFLPLDVYGDDTFTPQIEALVPFSLGVRVRNTGAGTAKGLKIESAQPQITENNQGLLIGFSLTGSEVNGQAATDSLLADFGNIKPNGTGVARWIMTTSLSGKFWDFDAYYTHADELGGKMTSLITDIYTHTLVQNVVVDLPGRDNIRDFMGKNEDVYHVYESEIVSGGDLVVNDQSSYSSIQMSGGSGTITVPATAGFMYVQLDDPFNGQKLIKEVVRSDGKSINENNAWLSKTRDGENNWLYYINLFDVNTTSSYTIVFENPENGPQPPVLQFIPDRSRYEGEQLSFIVEASDPNGTIPMLSAAPLPAGATFTDRGDTITGGIATGVFDWTPAPGQSGRYEITYTAFDGLMKVSRKAVIIIYSLADTDGDGMRDGWEIEKFGDLSRNGTGDYDGDGISDLDEFLNGTDPTVNQPPVADAGDDMEINYGTAITLDGSGSNDPEGRTLSFAWSFVEVPTGSALTDASITGATTAGPSFTPDVPGTYVLRLTVGDGINTSSDEITLTAALGWYDPNWPYRQLISVNETSRPNSDLANFPLLVQITDDANQLFVSALANGDDILFTASDGTTRIPHEIERYITSEGSEELTAWVKIHVLSSTGDTSLYMYYGNPNASNQENAEGVWDENYVMVHHLNQESGSYYDSTSNNNDSNYINVTTRGVDGAIGGAVEFGANNYIGIPDTGVDSPLDLSGGGSITLSAWIHATGTGIYPGNQAGILSKGPNGGTNGYTLRIDGHNCTEYGDYTVMGTRAGNWYGICGTANNVTPNVWNYVEYIYDSSTQNHYLYVDGVLNSTDNFPAGATDTAADLRIGTWLGAYFDGFIDEVRISNTARSADWVASSYNNQNSPESYIASGQEEIVPYGAAGTISVNATLDGVPWSGALNFEFIGRQAFTGDTVPMIFTGREAGIYRASYVSGGPANMAFDGMTVSGQSLGVNGTITFTLNFKSECTLTVNHDTSAGVLSITPDLVSYPANTVVELTFNENFGYRFNGWSGNAEGTSRTITIAMDGDKVINVNTELKGLELTAHYKFDDPAQPAKDETGMYHGTVNGGVGLADSDLSNKAMYFDGVDDYINLGLVSAMTNSGGFTVSAWINHDATTQNGDAIMGNSYYSGDFTKGLVMRFWDSDTWFNAILGAPIRTYMASVVPMNTWTHLGVSYDWATQTMRHYQNGILMSERIGVGYTPSTNNLLIGSDYTNFGTVNFHGMIDEVKIFNQALSNREMLAIYNEVPRIDNINPEFRITSPGNYKIVLQGNDVVFTGTSRDASGISITSIDVYAVNRSLHTGNEAGRLLYSGVVNADPETGIWEYIISASDVAIDEVVTISGSTADNIGNVSEIKTSHVVVSDAFDTEAPEFTMNPTQAFAGQDLVISGTASDYSYLAFVYIDIENITQNKFVFSGTNDTTDKPNGIWSHTVPADQFYDGDILRVYAGAKDHTGNWSTYQIIRDILVGCGNGIISGTEQCDDGNTDAGDGCSEVCAIEDTDNDGMSDAWENQYFNDLSRDGTGDYDGDGISDLDEYLNGTNPVII